MAYMCAPVGTQPALAVFYLEKLKNISAETLTQQ